MKIKPDSILTMDDLNEFDASSDESDESEVDSDDSDHDKTGHAVAIGGYNEKEEYWIIKNSWGEKSGDKGY